VLADEDLHAIIRLQTHWEGHYWIWISDDVWHAKRLRHDRGVIFTAPSSWELSGQLKDDYAELAVYERRLAERAAGIGPAELQAADLAALNWLRMMYERYYQVDHIKPAADADAFWQAEWKGPGQPRTLVSATYLALRDLIREDLAERRYAERRAQLDAQVHPKFRR
jgi:hypothetical protein